MWDSLVVWLGDLMFVMIHQFCKCTKTERQKWIHIEISLDFSLNFTMYINYIHT